MGNRANIVIFDGEGRRVYLYGHWMGADYVRFARDALAKEWRWTQAPYLARIVFDVMTDGFHGEELGFGISTSAPDNEHPICVLDVPAQVVRFEDRHGAPLPVPHVSFTEFAKFTDRRCHTLARIAKGAA